jgi:RNA polymerase-binding transcription factor DksA
MASSDPGPRSAASLLADPADDLPRWRERLERLWRRQVEEIIELSLAYHEAASAEQAGDRPDLIAARSPSAEQAGDRPELIAARSRRLQLTRARAASAHHALAEIEAALARIDAASYGICEQCGERLRSDWLEATPQLRYCRRCRPFRPDRWHPPRGAPGRDHHDR